MGKKLKFTLEEEEKIVDFVKNNEVLFNVRHKAFRDAELKNRLWLELANELHVDSEFSLILQFFADFIQSNRLLYSAHN